MSNYNNLKTSIADVIKQNGTNAITGNLLQQALLAMVNSLGDGFQFKGVATQETQPGTPDQKVLYVSTPGTYTNFGGVVVPEQNIGFITYDGSWHVSTLKVSPFAVQTVISDIIQLYDGANPVYPKTRVEAVFFDNGMTLDKKLETLEMFPYSVKYSNKYISSIGEVLDENGYFISNPFLIKEGQIVSVIARNGSGDFAVLSQCNQDLTEIVPLLTYHGKENKIQYYKAQSDTLVCLCGASNGIDVTIFDGDNFIVPRQLLLKNLAETNFGTGWYGVNVDFTTEDGIAHCVNRQVENVYTRVEFPYNFIKGHTYFVCISVRTGNFKNGSIYLQHFCPWYNLYKNDGWTQMFTLQKIESDNVNNVGFYVKDNYSLFGLSENDRKFDLFRPIIIDVTEILESINNVEITTTPLKPVVSLNNHYISTLGEILDENGYFVSEVMPVKKGDIFAITSNLYSGYGTVLAKCDSDMTNVVPLLQYPSQIPNDADVETYYTIKEDGYVIFSGVDNQVTYQKVNENLSYKFLKVANIWKDINKPFAFDVKTLFVSDEPRIVVAGFDSRMKNNADIICSGKDDQEIINRIIKTTTFEEIYLADDSVLKVSAPIYPKNNLTLLSKGAEILMCDMITNTVTQRSDTVFSVDDVSDYTIGMLLYCDGDNQYNRIKNLFPATKQIELEISHHYSDVDFAVKTASNAIFIDKCENVIINGIHIDLNVVNNPRQELNPWYLQEGIQVAYSEKVWIQNCKINNGGRRGICTTDSKYFWITNNSFNNWHEHSIDIWTSYTLPYDGYENLNPMMAFGVISGNVCTNNQMSGIQCHRGSGCAITGNVIKSCPHGGIRNQEHSHHNTIVGNVIENCGAGLYLGGHDIVATGNSIKDCEHGCLIGEYSARVKVSNNDIDNCKDSAIVFQSAQECEVSYNTIKNSCLESGDSIIRFNEAPSPVYETDNFQNIVISNTFMELGETLPEYIFYNTQANRKNICIKNLCILNGNISTPFVYDQTDVVRDNEMINT